MSQFNKVSFVQPFKNRLTSWNTPDYLERKEDNHIPVMVMDSMKIGGASYSLIEQHDYLGEGITVSERFQMRESAVYDDVMFHRIPDEEYAKGMVSSSVVGDVFVVDPITLCELDRHYQNEFLFQRVQFWVWLLDQTSTFKSKSRASLKVWGYVQREEYWKEKVYRICAPKTKTKNRHVYDFDAAQDYANSKAYGFYDDKDWVM